MKPKKELLKRWRIECDKWGKASQIHANSKESHIKTHVTKNEHITGEKLSFIEGWISALEWVINDDDLLSKDKTPPTMGKDKKYKRLLDKFLERERKKVRGGSGDDMFYEQQIIDYVGKQEDFLITLIKFVEKELNEGNCKIEKLKREMEDTNKKIRGLL